MLGEVFTLLCGTSNSVLFSYSSDIMSQLSIFFAQVEKEAPEVIWPKWENIPSRRINSLYKDYDDISMTDALYSVRDPSSLLTT